MKTAKKINYLLSLCSLFICLNALGEDITFDITINNQLNNKILISPTTDFSKLSGSTGKIFSEIPDEKQIIPTLVLEKVSMGEDSSIRAEKSNLELLPFKKTNFFATLREISFKKLKITEKPFIVQRLIIEDKENNKIIGYISFRCSIYNTNPIITMEPEQSYTIAEERMFFGGGIHLIIKNS